MRVVDIDRIGSAAASDLQADEAWVVDPDCRTDPMAREGRHRLPPGQRAQLVVVPGPLAELEERVARHLAAGGPKAVRLCPGPAAHAYPLEPWVVGPLLAWCDREELAVMIDPGPVGATDVYPWSAVVRLARDHPSLVVVALAAPLGPPTATHALDAAPNLVLATSGLTERTTHALGALVETAGAYRFAYGSGDRSVAPSDVSAALPEAAREEVLAGTADRIATGTWGRTYL